MEIERISVFAWTWRHGTGRFLEGRFEMRKLILRVLEFRHRRGGSDSLHAVGLVIRLGALILLAAASGQANAQTFTSLLSFTGTGGAYPGHYPGGDVTLSGTTLYGMTALGGSGGDGSFSASGSTAQTTRTYSRSAETVDRLPDRLHWVGQRSAARHCTE